MLIYSIRKTETEIVFKNTSNVFILVSSGCLVLFVYDLYTGSNLTDFLRSALGGGGLCGSSIWIVKHFEGPQTSYFFV